MCSKVRLIYNPYSGENKIVSQLDFIIDAHQKAGYILEPYRYTFESGKEGATAGLDKSYHHLLIAGGDGTINTIVNQLKADNIDLPIALLPTGTANDFAHLLGYNNNLRKACIEGLNGTTHSIDLGQAGNTYFVNVLSAGLFTDVSQKTPTQLKNTFGKLAYYFTSYISSIQELPTFKKIHIKIDSKEVIFDDQTLIFFVFNGRTAGNMNFAYRSDVQDGLLDVLLIKGDNIADTIRTAFHFLTNNEKNYPKGVVHFKSRELTVYSDDNLSVDIDGEAGPTTPFKITCVKNALRVITPYKKEDDGEIEVL